MMRLLLVLLGLLAGCGPTGARTQPFLIGHPEKEKVAPVATTVKEKP